MISTPHRPAMITITQVEIFPVGVPITRGFTFASGNAGAAGQKAVLVFVKLTASSGQIASPSTVSSEPSDRSSSSAVASPASSESKASHKDATLSVVFVDVTQVRLDKVGRYFQVRIFAKPQADPTKDFISFLWRAEERAKQVVELLDALRIKK